MNRWSGIFAGLFVLCFLQGPWPTPAALAKHSSTTGAIQTSIELGDAKEPATSSKDSAATSPAQTANDNPADAVAKPANQPEPAVLSLEDCITQALAKRHILLAKLENVNVRKAQLQRAKNARWLPKVDLLVATGAVPDVAPGFGPPGFPPHSIDWSEWGPFVKVQIDAFQPIYTWEKIGGAIDAAKLGVKDAELQQEAQEWEIKTRVRRAYWALSLAFTLYKFLDDSQRQLADAEKKLEEMIEAGSTEVKDVDKFKIRVYKYTLKRRRVEADVGIDLLKLALGFLISHPNPTSIRIKDERLLRLRQIPQVTLEEAVQAAMRNRAEVKRINNLLGIRKAQVRIARSSLLPSFFIAGQYKYSYAPGREDMQNPYLVDDWNRSTGGAGVFLRQQLSFQNHLPEYDRSKAELRQSENERYEVLQAVKLDVERAYYELDKNWRSLTDQRQAVRSARSWIAAETLNFNMGVAPTKDLLQAYVAYSEVLVSYHQRVYDIRDSLAKLAKAMQQDFAEKEKS